MEQLKKSAFLLKEIFEEAFKARLESNKINNPENPYDGQQELFGGAFEGGLNSQDAHFLFVKTLENYNWDLNKFFTAAANPQINFHQGTSKLDKYSDCSEIKMDSKDYEALEVPKGNINNTAQRAIENIEKLAAKL